MVLVLGVIALVVGFVLVAPRDATPGSAALRNRDVGIFGIFRTPGYQRLDDHTWTVVRVVGGLALVGGGLALIALGS